MGLEQCLHFGFVVERRIVHDDKAVWVKFWYQHLLHPRRDRVVRAAALKQHRRDPLISALRHYEVGALAIITADFSVDFFTAFCPSVRTIAVFCESTFIKVDYVLCAVLLHPLAKRSQIIYSATVMTFRVPRRFFYGCRADEVL